MPADDSFSVIIPARFASQRFPGKVLANIADKPMIQHVYEQAQQSKAEAVYIATDDERIAERARQFNAEVIMTSPRLASGTERVYQAASSRGLPSDSLIVNVQGDEPLLPAENINQVAELVKQGVDMASLVVPITSKEELHNEDCVKVVMNNRSQALFFSRSAIPHHATDLDHYYRHLGIYAYSLRFLTQYTQWPSCAYEKIEKLEQLRALYYGAIIQLAEAKVVPPPGVDRPADIQHIETLLSDTNC